MQGSSPNVASAAAAAISAAVEGSPKTAEAVAKAGGLDLLLSVMKKGTQRCKTSAVEALQVCTPLTLEPKCMSSRRKLEWLPHILTGPVVNALMSYTCTCWVLLTHESE